MERELRRRSFSAQFRGGRLSSGHSERTGLPPGHRMEFSWQRDRRGDQAKKADDEDTDAAFGILRSCDVS
jgi:hypothetical protein